MKLKDLGDLAYFLVWMFMLRMIFLAYLFNKTSLTNSATMQGMFSSKSDSGQDDSSMADAHLCRSTICALQEA